MDDIGEKEFGELVSDVKWLRQEIKEIKEMIKQDIKDMQKRIENLEKFRDKVKGATMIISVLLGSSAIIYLISYLLGG